MAIKCLKKCGEVCQKNIAVTLFAIMGIIYKLEHDFSDLH